MCLLCGNPTDQIGRFCTSCVGEVGPASAPSWGRPVRLGEARLRLLRTIQWPVVLLLFAGVGVAGARAAESWQATRQAHVAVFTHTARSLSVAQLAITIATGAVFLAWWALAYRNLGALGIRRRNPTSWAVLSWFVPLVSLVAPKRVAEELRAGSDADTPLGWSYGRGTMSPLVTGWWVCWLASLALPVAANLALPLAMRRPELVGVFGAAFLASGLLVGVAGLCAAVLVGQVTGGQAARAQALTDAGLLGPA